MNCLTRVKCGCDLEREVRESDCVCMCNPTLEDMDLVARACETHGKGLYILWSMGTRGLCAVWLGRHTYVTKEKEPKTVTIDYPGLRSVFSSAPGGTSVYDPSVSAVMAGIVSQDVVKVITGRGEPIHNVFHYDRLTGSGWVRLQGQGV